MRILQLHTTLRSGGIEAFITSLSNELSQCHDVTVCTIFELTDNDIFYRHLNPTIIRLSLGKRGSGFSLKSIWRIFRTIIKGDYDVVHLHGCFYYYALAILLLHKKVKFIYTVHTDAERENLGWDKKLLPLKRLAFKRGWMHAATISDKSKQSFDTFYPKTPNRLIINGITRPIVTKNTFNADVYRTNSKTKLFIHAGRITEAKNQLVLCQVFKQLIDEGEDVKLLICGANENQSIYNSISAYFGDHIIYLGERDDVTSIMFQCDAFCLPSIWEGMPITLLEAMAVGCIPICSPVGGIPATITHKVSGFLSKDSTSEAYIMAVREFLATPLSKISQIKQHIQTTFLKYDISKTAKEYIEYYIN